MTEPRIITFYSVEITDPTNRWKRKNHFTVEEFRVLGENDYCLVIDNLHFTTINKKASEHSTCLGKSSIGITSGDSFWGNSINYRLYTDGKKRRSTIKNEIEAAVVKKYGFFMSSLDLRILDKEPKTGGEA